MSPSKVNTDRRRGDVPPTIVAGVLAALVALFLPMAHRAPAYPTELPPLRADAAAVMREHRAALATPAPPGTREVLAAWRRLAEVTARRDEDAYAAAQHLFATRLGDATLHDRAQERAIQARGLDAFLRAARDGQGDDPVVALARRHRLVGPGASARATDATRAAWFLMRWERMALPTPTQGEMERLVDTLGRLPRATQVAFAAWSLDAPCAELLGTAARGRGPEGVRACAQLRREMIEVAAGADRRYPRAEALAAVEMLLGAGLMRHADPARRESVGLDGAVDESVARRARDEAAAAFQRAVVRYEALKREHPSRRFERYEVAAIAELAASQ